LEAKTQGQSRPKYMEVKPVF